VSIEVVDDDSHQLGIQPADDGLVSCDFSVFTEPTWRVASTSWGQPDREPEGPVLMQCGGGGGSAGSGRVTMNPAYWLWPLPPSGTLHLFVERPGLGVALSSADLDGSAIRGAASKSQPFWNNLDGNAEAR
jgi:hypothetical protein